MARGQAAEVYKFINKKLRISRYFFFILVIALLTRIGYLAMFNQIPLEGDAPGFVSQAQAMDNFYRPSTREPFWILWVKFTGTIFKDYTTGLRIGHIFLQLIAAVLIFLIIRKRLGEIPAIVGSSFFLFTPYMYFSMIRAHRLEFYIVLLLSLTAIYFLKSRFYIREILLGLTAGLIILVRQESLLIVGIVFALFLFERKVLFKLRIIKMAISLFVMLLIAGPFFYNCYKEKGTPFYILNTHARFWDSHEYAGKPRGRSPDVVLKSPYDGRNVSVLEYLFKERSIIEISGRFLKGYANALTVAAPHLLSWKIYFGAKWLDFYKWIFIPILVGLILSCFYKQSRSLILWGALYILPHSFILSLSVVGRPSVDIRFAASQIPLLSFSAAGFVWFIRNKCLKV